MVQKYFLHDCSTYSLPCSERGKKESDEKNIKTRQRQDIDVTVLLLETRYQGKLTLRSCYQSIGTVVKPLPPMLSYLIPWTRRLSSFNDYVVVVKSSCSSYSSDASVVVVDSSVPSSIPRRLRHCLLSLKRIVCSLSSTGAYIVVSDSSGLSPSIDAVVVIVNFLGP